MNISIENNPLVLFADTSIPASFSHPFFSDEGFHSFDVQVPYPENAHIFGFPNNPHSAEEQPESYSAKIDTGVRQLHCKCIVQAANDEYLILNFFFDESSFYLSIRDKSIRDLPFAERFQFNTPHVSSLHSEVADGFFVPGGTEFKFFHFTGANSNPYNNTNNRWYTINENNPLSGFIGNHYFFRINHASLANPNSVKFLFCFDHTFQNNQQEQLGLFAYRLIPNTQMPIYHTIAPLVERNKVYFWEMAFLMHENIGFYLGVTNLTEQNFPQWTPSDYFMNRAHISVFETFPSLSKDNFANACRFFPARYNFLNHDDNTLPRGYFADYVNFSDSGNLTWAKGINGYTEAYVNTLIPSFFVQYVLQYIEQFTGYTFDLSELPADFENFVVLGYVCLTNFKHFETPSHLFSSSFTANDILPPVSIDKFLKALEDATGSYIVVDESLRQVSFRSKKNTLLSSPVFDATTLSEDLSYEHTEKPAGFSFSIKGHPDPQFKINYKSLQGINVLGTTSLNTQDLETANVNDAWLIIGASFPTRPDGYYVWNGASWRLHSRYPAMEVLYNVKSRNILSYELSFFPAISLLQMSPLNESFPSHIIPVTNLEVFYIDRVYDDLTGSLIESLKLIFSIYRGEQLYDNGSAAYDMLSHDVLDNAKEPIEGADYSALIGGTGNLFDAAYSDYFYFLLHRNKTFNVSFNPANQLAFPRGRIQIDNAVFIVHSQEFTFVRRATSKIKAVLRQVN